MERTLANGRPGPRSQTSVVSTWTAFPVHSAMPMAGGDFFFFHLDVLGSEEATEGKVRNLFLPLHQT